MTALKSILEEIKAGTTSFAPASGKEEDMRDFQPIAKLLEYANTKGLLASYKPHKESSTGHRWYDLVLVSGGLSYEGEMFLASANEQVEREAESIVHLKPNFYGVGVDLNALWKRWKNRNG